MIAWSNMYLESLILALLNVWEWKREAWRKKYQTQLYLAKVPLKKQKKLISAISTGNVNGKSIE